MKLPRTPFPENNSTMPYQYEPGTIVVGIDLGTTNTVCFVYDGSGYEVIKFGNLTVLPSYVQYKKNGTVVCGEVAKGNYGKKQFWVISNSKRIIGRPYSKEQIKNLSQNCGVPIVDDHGIPKFHLDNIKRDVSATDVASEIIRTVIDAVREKYPGKRIVFLTPFHRSSEAANKVGATLAQYKQAIYDVARDEFGFAVLDGWTVGLSPKNAKVKAEYIVDGVHPNPIGHELIGANLARMLNAI